MRYLMTHSLLSSWLYALKENENEDATTERDTMAEFMQVLRREPTPTSEAMQNGIDFEELVMQILRGMSPEGDSWGEAAAIVADRVRGGVFQYKAYQNIRIGNLTLLLNGRLDCLKAGSIFDIKFTKHYEPGKYYDSTQHPMYFEHPVNRNSQSMLLHGRYLREILFPLVPCRIRTYTPNRLNNRQPLL